MRTVLFSPPYITDQDIDAVAQVLRSGWITSGEVGREFANMLASYTRANHVCLMNSATAALFSALKLMGIGPGDEVITTPYTFAATANVVFHTGADIVFADTAPGSFYIDPEEIYKKITPKTKAVIPVDFSTASGIILDYDVLARKFVSDNKFQEALGRPLVLVDAAHALGSRFIDESVDMAAYSFHAVKNLTSSEGGVLALRSFGDEELDREFIRNLSVFILHGQDKSARDKFASGSWEYDIVMPGYKLNMPDTLAALGLSQLKRYESESLPHRRKLVSHYIDILRSNDNIIMEEPTVFSHVEQSSCHLMPVRINGFDEIRRNQLIQYCFEHNVSANVHYKPLNLMSVSSYYNNIKEMPCSFAQYVNQISLPLHMQMNKEDVEYVCEILLKGTNV
ncbi:MAG: DegT/DnrJ/EryC1/StrS family aminotransferase [Brevinemataceae bacterium]